MIRWGVKKRVPPDKFSQVDFKQTVGKHHLHERDSVIELDEGHKLGEAMSSQGVEIKSKAG